MQHSRNVLVVTADTLAPRMAGPAIRAFEMAKAVSKVANVRLVSTQSNALDHPDFSILEVTDAELREQEAWADVIVFQGHLLSSHPWIVDSEKLVVADLYDPMHLEDLEQGKYLPESDRIHASGQVVEVLSDQILRADFMMCASEKQRDFWLGHLGAMGRINPITYDDDPTLRTILDVVPFGVNDELPTQTTHAIKGAIDGITHDDKVILWGGGIYNWFDPLTLINAVHSLSQRHPNIRLFFLGVQHPNPHVPTMRMAVDAQKLAAELGLLNKVVFFNEGWVPYETRADYLLDADVGVSTHLDKLETAYSFRTRILDYLWTSLPIVSTAGDTFADLIAAHGLGRVVPPDDVESLSAALEAVLFDDAEHAATAERVKEFAQTMAWSNALVPLINFCLNGSRAADLQREIRLAGNMRLKDLQTRVAGLERSFSWRVTAPIRALTGTVRRLRER